MWGTRRSTVRVQKRTKVYYYFIYLFFSKNRLSNDTDRVPVRIVVLTESYIFIRQRSSRINIVGGVLEGDTNTADLASGNRRGATTVSRGLFLASTVPASALLLYRFARIFKTDACLLDF